jgi:hypothetical protein
MKRGVGSRAIMKGAERALVLAALAGVTWASGAREVEAQTRGQQRGDMVGSLGAGGTLYAVDTRLDEGHMIRGSVGYALTPAWLLEAGVRRHGCFDCQRFWIVDAGVQWQRPGERFSPFVSAGGGRASDPGFMGTEWGPYASVGSGVRFSETTSLQLEFRVRQLGGAMRSPDGMGELTMGVTRRMWARSP